MRPVAVRPPQAPEQPTEQDVRGLRSAGAPVGVRMVRTTIGSAWLPAIVVTAFLAGLLRIYGVPFTSTLHFLGYLALGVALPGTLLWRAVQGRASWFVSDVAAGAALGYALEVLVYIAVRALGLPLLVLAWPIATIVAFVAVPGLRRFWRGSGERTPPWWGWSMAGLVAILGVWSGLRFFRYHGLVWPYMGAPDADSPFHLALIGEAKHHMPLTSPWLSGEPLYYHWFVYADMAATSWVTGLEPQLLLLRLSPLPMIIGLGVLVAVIARRLTGLWWAGLAAAVSTFLVLAPNPYPWPLDPWFSTFSTSPYDDGSSFRAVLWTSPTHTFAAMLFAALVLVLVGLVRGESRGWWQWALFTILLVAVMGAKATFLPILLAALLAVVFVELVARRRWHRPALVAAGLTVLCVFFAQFVLFGGASQGLAIDPLHQMRISGGPYTTSFTTGAYPPRWHLLLALGLTLLCWTSVWAGIGGLLVRRRFLDPTVALLLGIGAAGMGGILLFGQDGGAEGWFLGVARPYLCIASVLGVVALIGARRLAWPAGAAILAAVALGAAVIHLLRAVSSNRVPTTSVAFALTWPYLVLAGAVALFAVLLLRSRDRRLAGLRAALVVSMLAGFGIFAAADHVAEGARVSLAKGWRNQLYAGPFISKGTLEAGRWLRDHSAPNDLIATNAHCLPYPGTPRGRCDDRHFAISAFSERRFLVEGWGFTSASHTQSTLQNVSFVYVDFWDPQRLADNDAAFRAPSAQTVDRLRERYGVRWLFVDASAGPVGNNLGRFATLRFTSGVCSVYEISPSLPAP